MIDTKPPISKDSESWRPIKSWLLKQIHAAQRQLEQVGPSEAEHNKTRGEIAAWRGMISAVEPQQVPEDSDDRDYLED